MRRPLGVYVHVPYCSAICPYCDFNVYRLRKDVAWDGLFSAYEAELRARVETLPDGVYALETLYLGGGTPSLAPPEHLAALIAQAGEILGNPPREVTLEADPQTFTASRVAAWRAAGVTRLSMGWQSTKPALLKRLGRLHTAPEANAAFAMARAAGFENINVDLMLAVPGQTLDDLHGDLEALAAVGPEHVSVYALTYHAGTPFHRWRESGKIAAAPEGLELEMMRAVTRALGESGYDHYEVSNYARPGYRSLHNQMYWRGDTVLGIGPGAHGLVRSSVESARRWSNVRLPSAYIDAWSGEGSENGEAWSECLDAEAVALEHVALGVRQEEGFTLPTALRAVLPLDLDRRLDEAELRGWLVRRDDRIIPTPRGRELADSLSAHLCC